MARNANLRAFTFIDLLIVLVTLCFASAIVYTRLNRPKARGHPMNCVNNLKQVGLAARMFSNDHNEKFPWDVALAEGGTKEHATNIDAILHFTPMINELTTPKVLFCPTDKKRARASDWALVSNKNLSYFVGLEADETRPQTILSGDRNLLIDNTNFTGFVTATTNSTINIAPELHEPEINIALADGSVQQMTVDILRKQIREKNELPLRFIIP
ncbi:MAG TPA: hypothetical protein VGE41_12360 [Verrucomicrobiae bacterium]|jgi:hypothetical protein